MRGTSRRGGIGRGLPAAAAALEAGVGRKSGDDDDDDGNVDVEIEGNDIECAAGVDTPVRPLPARAASQGEGGFGLTRDSIFKKRRSEGKSSLSK